jgi:hypothetical protein
MKTTHLTRWAFGGVVLALAAIIASPVQAGCTSDRTFGTYPSAAGDNFYVSSPGMNTADSMEGFYWVLGEGPTRNSGDYNFDGTGGSQPWFIPGSPFANGWSLTTTVNNGKTVGCPAPDPTVWVFSDLSADGKDSLFGIMAADHELSDFLAYDLGKAGSLALEPMPASHVTNSSVTGGKVTAELRWAPEVAFSTSSQSITKAGQVISGWNVYAFEVARGAAAPSTREIDQWTQVGTIAGATSGSGSVTFSCADASNEVFLALAPDFDNGFTSTAYVGADSGRLDCASAQAGRRRLK